MQTQLTTHTTTINVKTNISACGTKIINLVLCLLEYCMICLETVLVWCHIVDHLYPLIPSPEKQIENLAGVKCYTTNNVQGTDAWKKKKEIPLFEDKFVERRDGR